MACCSSGVMTTRWLCRRGSRVSMAMMNRRGGALEGEPLPEINLTGFCVAGDLRSRPRDEDRPIVHDVGAIRDGECLAHVVVGDEDADAPIAQASDDFLDVA